MRHNSPFFLPSRLSPLLSDRCLAAESCSARMGGIVYKPSLCMGKSRRVWNSFPCLPPTRSFTLLRAESLEECFAFHSSLRPFTTITFAVINFAAVHTDRCNCYARRIRLHLLKPPTYSILWGPPFLYIYISVYNFFLKNATFLLCP